MKRRYRFLLNVFALALLAFSLYLNFVKKDAPEISLAIGAAPQPVEAATDKQLQKEDTGQNHSSQTVAAVK